LASESLLCITWEGNSLPENIDDSLLLAIERYKNGQETTDDLLIIRQALISKRIVIVPAEGSKISEQSGGADFGELNRILVSGSVIGTQSLSGFTTEQVVELLRLYDSSKESVDSSEPEIQANQNRGHFRRRIFLTVFGLIAFLATFLAGIYLADFVPPIKSQHPVMATAFALIPITGATNTSTIPAPSQTPTSPLTLFSKPTMTTSSSQAISLSPSLGFTPSPTNNPTPTQTQTYSVTPTRTPTNTMTPTSYPTNTDTPSQTSTVTPTPTPEVLFTDTFEDFEYSTHIGWILFTEEEGKIYRRRITQDKIDNKFEHIIDCLSQTCVGRNDIPPVAKYENFKLSFDVQYLKIPLTFTGISRPIVCINYRQFDPRSYYAICFNSDGRYRIARYVNGELTIIRDWQRSLELNRETEKNEIRITANRSNYLFEANGVEVAEFQDNNLLGAGNIEIVIYSFKDSPGQKSEVILEIDNVEIVNVP
jgi:hypothetical protein